MKTFETYEKVVFARGFVTKGGAFTILATYVIFLILMMVFWR